jgi:Zn-dependent protease with chaperone function
VGGAVVAAIPGPAAACPSCGRPVTEEPGFSAWCPACDWNVDPIAVRPATVGFRERYERVGRRAAEQRLSGLLGRSDVRSTFTIVGAVLLGISILIIGSTIAIGVIGVWLLFNAPGLYGILGGGLCIGLAVVLRPRVLPLPPDVIDRRSNPRLFALPDAVADIIGTRRADLIVVNADFNASVSERGWRRRRVLTLGLPMLAILEPDERAAILGHEFGHYANGDPLRGFVVWTGVETLEGWYRLLRPDGIFHSPEPNLIPGLLMAPFNILMLAFAQIPLMALRGITLFALGEGQRAEYLADILAARVAGPRALVSAWHKFHLADAAVTVTMASSDQHWENRSLWDELRKRAALIPASQLERARRIDLKTGTRLDASHPPTEFRIRLAESLARNSTGSRIAAPLSNTFELALRGQADRVGREAIDHHLGSLHHDYRLAVPDPYLVTLDDIV